MGYVVETALKAAICTLLGTDWPPPGGDRIRQAYQTHSLPDLVLLAGLNGELKTRQNASTQFAVNWRYVLDWNETRRYATIGTSTRSDAENLRTALTDPTNGIFIWLQTKW